MPKTNTLKETSRQSDEQTDRQTERLTNILTTISACQDFCKWHFTQLCQGYRHFCLLTYAHSEFVPKTKILEGTSRGSDEQTNWKADKLKCWQTYWQQFRLQFSQIKTIRLTDRLTGQRQNIGEKKTLRQLDEKLGRPFKSRWTDEMINWLIIANVLHLDMGKKVCVFKEIYVRNHANTNA